MPPPMMTTSAVLHRNRFTLLAAELPSILALQCGGSTCTSGGRYCIAEVTFFPSVILPRLLALPSLK